MSENVNTFPHSKVEALTMLYLQNQDLSSVTPEKLLTLYSETYQKIFEADNARKSDKYKERRKQNN